MIVTRVVSFVNLTGLAKRARMQSGPIHAEERGLEPMRPFLVAVLLLTLMAPGLVADDKGKTQNEEAKRMKFDLKFKYDPRELHEYSDDLKRWKHIKGIFYLGTYHVPPGHISGRNLGPPRYIWTNGFGTSLWRDPVTGWPIL